MEVTECAKEIHIPIHQEPCVICFDTVDNKGHQCCRSTSLLIARCDCDYAVHKKCMNEWLENRPSSNVQCLICSSEAETVLSCSERSLECWMRIRSEDSVRKLIVCVGWIVILFFIFIIVESPVFSDEQVN